MSLALTTTYENGSFQKRIRRFCETPGKNLVKASNLRSKTLLLPSP